jgi:glycosyltransferase involved in cell wall biosynthesis
MRILEVTHYIPPHMGGIERVAASLVEGLSRRGHRVRWISSAVPARPGRDSETVRVRAWNVLEDRVGVPYPIWSPSAMPALAREVRDCDVVHVHDCLYMGSAAAATLCRRYDKPLLITQHVGYVPFGAALDAVQRTAYQTLGRSVLAAADARVACSAHVPQYFESLGFPGPFTLIPNAIDETRFHPVDEHAQRTAREAWGVRGNARVALFVGRLVPKKAVDRVLAVQRMLASEGATLLIVGDGPLASLIAGTPSVVHHRSVAPERMPELYAAADAFVLPSRGEGLPLSVQEAMMCGLPVVVSDDASYTANLSGAPGVAFAHDDAALTSELRKALFTARERESIAAHARERWGGEQFVQGYEAILFRLAHSARGTAP